MKEIHYDFVELDSDEPFRLFGKAFGGIVHNQSLLFDNSLSKGELVKSTPEEGLWIRKWKFTVHQKITLHKLPPSKGAEQKFSLIYFLNPDLFTLKVKRKKLKVTCLHNNLFLPGSAPIDFSVLPKQPFYLLDITFTAPWLIQQFKNAEPSSKESLERHILQNNQITSVAPCCAEEYKTLQELEASMKADREDLLFIRSRVYNLLGNFLSKLFHQKEAVSLQGIVHYNQVVEAERIIMENITSPPKINTIAKKVNMSVSSLLRQFKFMYGKRIYEYHLEKKMELAKRLMQVERKPVKEMAALLGYKQVSAFIEAFSKHYGCSPGSLKASNNYSIS